jgi:uncharacterized RmlC-like cupin family protein
MREAAMSDPGVRVIRASERKAAAVPTPGMRREEAFSDESVWIGTVRTEPGVETGWHHHGRYASWIYVVTGRPRIEFGPDGSEALIAEPGDIIEVAPGSIHRELCPGPDPAQAVLFRVGSGEVTFNTDGPGPTR